MTKSLKLVDYQINKMSCNWIGISPMEEQNESLSIDYDIYTQKANSKIYKIDLMVKINPKEKGNGLYIDTKIVGLFEFNHDASNEDMQKSIRYSGFPLLYSTLRGHISSVTAKFPCGSFLLPSIIVKDVVSYIEKIKNNTIKQ